MNIKELHEYTGKLLAAGQPANMPVTVLIDGEMLEVQEVELLEGPYAGDASPKLTPSVSRTGRMLALCPVHDDFSEVLSDPTGCKYVEVDLSQWKHSTR